MKYDDASWHSEGDYPEDLCPHAAATHIGMFLAWALRHDLGSASSEPHRDEVMREADTPGQLLLRHCDGMLTDEELNPLGNRFAAYYYGADDLMYYRDLDAIFGRELDCLYRMKDDWQTLRRIEPKLTQRLREFSGL